MGEKPYWNGQGIHQIRAQLPEGWTPLTDRIEAYIIYRPPTMARRDIDFGGEAIKDALERAGVVHNDVQIRPTHEDFGPPCKDGIVWIKLIRHPIRVWDVIPGTYGGELSAPTLLQDKENRDLLHSRTSGYPDGKEQDPWQTRMADDRSGQLSLFATDVAKCRDPRP